MPTPRPIQLARPDRSPPPGWTAILALALMALPLSAAAQDETDPAAADPMEATWAWLADTEQAAWQIEHGSENPGVMAFETLAAQLGTDSEPDLDSLLEAALAARVGGQLASLPRDQRPALIDALGQHPDLAREVALLLTPEDDAAAAYRVLGRLIEAEGEAVAELAPLAAALAAVHDQPRDRRVNENTAPLIDPVELFAYFRANERQLRFSPRTAPASLLLLVADANGSIEELEWARRRYGRDRNVGNRYQEITYDTRAFRRDDATKRVTEADAYTLQNIRKLGGVCADQAYFAMTVGKAAGVPACYVVGRGGEVSHAWLGFLEPAGRTGARWNFEAGRYDDYEDVQGTVLHPQHWQRVPDAWLAVAAHETWIEPEDRHHSAALADAADRVLRIAREFDAMDDLGPEFRAKQLDILERSLRLNPGNTRAWRLAAELLASPGLSLELRERWARAIDTLAGRDYPDFAFEILGPMFDAEQDPQVRYNLWDWAATRYQGRKDLPARARLAQARILVELDRPGDAYDLARDIFERYHEGGPVAIEALSLAEQLVMERSDQAAAIDLYKWAFRQPRQPSRMRGVFLRQTAWYQVGTRYAELLDAAGDTREAQAIRRRLDR